MLPYLYGAKVPVINKKIFTPPGPVLDYSNRELFDFLLEEVKKVAKQRGAFVLKLDPDLPSSNTAVDAYLREKGFSSQANQDFEGIQPRYVFRLILPLQLMNSLPICTAKPAIISDLPGAGAYP